MGPPSSRLPACLYAFWSRLVSGSVPHTEPLPPPCLPPCLVSVGQAATGAADVAAAEREHRARGTGAAGGAGGRHAAPDAALSGRRYAAGPQRGPQLALPCICQHCPLHCRTTLNVDNHYNFTEQSGALTHIRASHRGGRAARSEGLPLWRLRWSKEIKTHAWQRGSPGIAEDPHGEMFGFGAQVRTLDGWTGMQNRWCRQGETGVFWKG